MPIIEPVGNLTEISVSIRNPVTMLELVTHRRRPYLVIDRGKAAYSFVR